MKISFQLQTSRGSRWSQQGQNTIIVVVVQSLEHSRRKPETANRIDLQLADWRWDRVHSYLIAQCREAWRFSLLRARRSCRPKALSRCRAAVRCGPGMQGFYRYCSP